MEFCQKSMVTLTEGHVLIGLESKLEAVAALFSSSSHQTRVIVQLFLTYKLLKLTNMATSSGTKAASEAEATNSTTDDMSIEDLQKEIEVLKRKIIDERSKLCDKTVNQVAEAIELIQGLNVKVRRSLKGHNAKVLCLDWSTDKRHLVSSSQVCYKNYNNVKYGDLIKEIFETAKYFFGGQLA